MSSHSHHLSMFVITCQRTLHESPTLLRTETDPSSTVVLASDATAKGSVCDPMPLLKDGVPTLSESSSSNPVLPMLDQDVLDKMIHQLPFSQKSNYAP